jgi:dTMP kinase
VLQFVGNLSGLEEERVPKHEGTGVLIAFEGVDGAGKTTQAALLAGVLTDILQDPPVTSKEPTNGSWGKRIRESASTARLDPQEELNYFMLDREEHTNNVIRPALDEGKIVILDRYYYSTIAYQGERGFSVNDLHTTMRERFITPDAVFLLDVDPAISLPRVRERGDVPNTFEEFGPLTRARALFASIKDDAIIKIDASMSIESVHAEVLNRFIYGPLKARRCAKSYGCDDPFHCIFRLSRTCDWARAIQSFQLASVR